MIQEPEHKSNGTFLQNPYVLKIRSFFSACLRWILATLGFFFRPVGRLCLRVPVIRRSTAWSQEKLKIPLVRNMAWMLLAVGIAFGGIFGFEALNGAFIGFIMSGIGKAPQTVSTVQVMSRPWQKSLHAVGSVRATSGADLSSEESGIVESITFQSGDDVQANTVLVTLRAEDDIAKLASLKAQQHLAQITYDRDKLQFKIQGISQATLDTDLANLDNDQAQVDEQQAIVDKKVIRAPFSGRLGIRSVDVGQYLTAGTSIVTLQALDNVYVDFYLPQQDVSQLSVGQNVALVTDTYPDRPFKGKITATSSLVDNSSRNLQVRATIANPDHKLLPGMFGTVSVEVGKPENELTLPETALTYNPYGTTVFVVKSVPQTPSLLQRCLNQTPPPLQTVDQVFVTTGNTQGDQVQILSGLKEGDTVVGAGQIKLHNGSFININNTVLPTDDANPSPTAENQPVPTPRS